jgi:hypothetical protein
MGVQRDCQGDFFAPADPACNDSSTMRAVRVRFAIVVGALAFGAAAGPAAAGRHRVERGQTLIEISKAYGCTVDELMRANHIDTTLIIAGRSIEIPRCKPARKKVARVDGSTKVRERIHDVKPRGRAKDVAIAPVTGQSIGSPWDGELRDAVKLRLGDGFRIRRPHRSYGASHVVAHVQQALWSVYDRFPDAHVLAIGDLSAKDGGAITEHRSHQSGRDVDIGFYFTRVPDGYPASFVEGGDDLDLGKMFAMLQAFARTADEPTGVAKIYLDFAIQGRLYKWARERDVPKSYLDALFQYPHGRGANAGLIRHEPHHDDHIHVRFKCAPDDDGCY